MASYVFSATKGGATELWITDGTADGTKQLADLVPGAQGSNPYAFKAFDGKAVFNTAAGMWITDGTSEGTRLLAPQRYSEALETGGKLYFTVYGVGLYVSDGVTIQLLKEFTDGAMRLIAEKDGKIVFTASGHGFGNVYWVSDGTQTGTAAYKTPDQKVVSAGPSAALKFESDAAIELHVTSPNEVYPALMELWRLRIGDDVFGDAVLIERITTYGVDAGFNGVQRLISLGDGKAIFSNYNSNQIWVTDGSRPGTVKLADGVSILDGATLSDGRAVIRTNSDLWVVDDHSVTRLVQGLNALSAFQPFGEGRALFKDAGRLWVTDGTAAGTFRLNSELATGDVSVFDGKVFFSIAGELWESDGTVAGTHRIVDIDPGSSIGTVQGFTEVTPAPAAGPLVISATVDADVMTLVYDEPLKASSDWELYRRFKITVDGETANPASVSIDAATGTVTLTLQSYVREGQAVTVTYIDPTGMDDAVAVIQAVDGVDAPDMRGPDLLGKVVTNITSDIKPVVQSAAAQGDHIDITFDRPLSSDYPPDAGRIVVTVDGQVVDIDFVDYASSTVVRLFLDEPLAEGAEVTVAYTDPTAGDDEYALQGRTGVDIADFNVDVIASAWDVSPELVSASINGRYLTLTFDQVMRASALPALSAFTALIDGQAVTVTQAAVDGAQVTLQLASSAAYGDDVSISYADPTAGDDVNALQNNAGRDVESFNWGAGNNTPATPPVLLQRSVDGVSVALKFDRDLDDGVEGLADRFMIYVAQTEAAIASVTVDGAEVIITLTAPVTPSQSVEVAYVDPSSGDDPHALQDYDGVDVETFLVSVSNVTATPPVLVSSSINGDALVLTFNRDLDATVGDLTDYFTVHVAGEQTTIGSSVVSGRQVTLTLVDPVIAGLIVHVAYDDPTNANDSGVLQGADGADVADLPLTWVTNNTSPPSSPPPAFTSASVNGSSLVLTYDRGLDAGVGDIADLFTVQVAGVDVEVASVAILGTTVTLTLAQAVTWGQAVQVAYDDPTGGNDPRALQSMQGADVADLVLTAATNITPQPNSPPPEPSPGQSPPPPGDPIATQDGREEAFVALGGIAPDSPKATQSTVVLDDGTVTANRNAQRAERFEALTEAFEKGEISRTDFIEEVVETQLDTTGAAVMIYQFFTGAAPSKGGVAWLVDSPDNARDLTDPYYAKFSPQNVFINLAAALGGEGEGRAAFQARYGALNFAEAVAQAYESVIGVDAATAAGIDVQQAMAYVVSRQTYFEALANSALGGKAAMVGYLMSASLDAEVGRYNNAIRDFMGGIIEGELEYGGSILPGAAPVGLVGVGETE